MYAKTTLTVVLALLTSAAFAGDEHRMGHEEALPSFTSLDANSDGSLSKEEANASEDVIEEWNEIDTDRNGVLSSSEYAKASATTDTDDDADDEGDEDD
jgi:hypothetical protein